MRLKELDLARTSQDDECINVLAAVPQLALLQMLVLADNPLIGEPGCKALAESTILAGLELLDLRGCSTWSQQVREELSASFGNRVLLPSAGVK